MLDILKTFGIVLGFTLVFGIGFTFATNELIKNFHIRECSVLAHEYGVISKLLKDPTVNKIYTPDLTVRLSETTLKLVSNDCPLQWK